MGNICFSRRARGVNRKDSRINLSEPPESQLGAHTQDVNLTEPEIIGPVSAGIKSKVAIALYSLHSENKELLSFEKGDKLIVEDESDPDWYLVRHINNQVRAFAPRTYLALDTVIGHEDWFFGNLARADAERLLSQEENEAGTFMVRESRAGLYALSIKGCVPETNEIVLKHYLIKRLDNGGYFVAPSKTFSTLKALIAYYSENANGLYQKLQNPCLRPRPTMPGPLPNNRDEYEVPFESLQFIRLLGKGNFGEVYYGVWNGTLEVAIKRLITSGVQEAEFLREVGVMKAVNHPKIVRLYAICSGKDPFCIVMEYLCNGSLQQYLKSVYGQRLRLPALVNMTAQIAEGMTYLESNNLIHRDLAARNILVGDNHIVKLADFGLARIMDEAVYITSGGKLPVKWTAPEAYTSGHFTIKSDVWSFGIVLYEIFTHGRAPYEGMKNHQVSELIRNSDYRMSKPDDRECSDAVYETMLQCWRKKPEDRPTFEYLFHYFTNYYIASEDFYREAT